MSLLIESIKLLDGEYCNLFFHEQRMSRSLRTLCGAEEHFHLEEFLRRLDTPKQGLFKCRIVYDEQSMDVQFVPYRPAYPRSLRLIEHDRISYEYKYADRKLLDRLFGLRKGCDDILIVKKGMITDTSYGNVVFKRGKNWYTPWSALLKGTQRQKLLERNMVFEEEIGTADLSTFESFKVINAMFEMDSPETTIEHIIK